MPRTLKPKVFRDKIRGEKMHTCFTCGKKYTYAELKYNNGCSEPAIGDYIEGVTSGDYGVLVSIDVASGSWLDGDAAGFMELSNLSGLSDGDIFEDGETLTTAHGGLPGVDVATVDGYGTEKSYGTMYPLSYLVKYKGKWYCKEHCLAHSKADAMTEGNFDFGSMESERGKLP